MLTVKYVRDALLGLVRSNKPTQDELVRDALRACQHSKSEEYQVWAEEAWSRISVNLQRACEARSDREAAIALGAVKGAMELLKIAHEARAQHDAVAKAMEAKDTRATLRR